MYRLVILASVVAAITAQSPYSSFCLQNLYGADQQNYFPDSTDCHYYISCDFINSSYAIGTRQKCADGQFWRPAVLSCLPEGDLPCADRCMSETVVKNRGCYAGTGCKQYFACSNTGSYGLCCPEGTEFVEANCACETSTTCNDFCELVAPATATTVKPSVEVNATVCKDSFDSLVSTVPGENNAFYLLTDAGIPTEKMYCAAGTVFEFATCRCAIVDENALPPVTPTQRKATLLLTFDADTQDSSIHKFNTFLYDGADRDGSSAAQGSGSLAVNGGFLTVPGYKTLDERGDGSICMFFRGTSGGILSNSRDNTNQEYTFRIGLSSPSNIRTIWQFWIPTNVDTVNVAFTNAANSWNHYCVVYTSFNNLATTYVNGQQTTQVLSGGLKFISHAPLLVGNDPTWGSFNGNIDEVMTADFALTAQEVNYHRNGNYAALDIN